MSLYGIFTFTMSFLKHYFLLMRSRKWDDHKTKQFSFDTLEKIIIYAWKHVPFYRNNWEKHGFSPEQFQCLEDLSKIPTMDKNDIILHLEELVPDDIDRNRLSLVSSGGTTGVPMQFYIDHPVARGKEIAFHFWGNRHYFGHRLFFERVAIIRGHRISEDKIKNNIFWEKSKKDNGLEFSSFHIFEKNYLLYLNELRNYKPYFIKAYPSSIVALCELMSKHGDFGISGLKGVICSSENVYDWQRKLVYDTLGVNIYSYYGHSEKCVCAFQGENNTMLFQPVYGYTEFLDDSLFPVTKNGELAQVVVTGYYHNYFPLIRYKTYDYVEVGESSSFQGKVAKKIIGRAQEFVYDKFKNRVPFTNSDEIMWEINGIIAYQYIQNEIGKLLLSLQVSNEFDMSNLELIRKRANEIFVNFDFDIKLVDSIERTKTGKFKYLVQTIDFRTIQ